jgi:DNA primase
MSAFSLSDLQAFDPQSSTRSGANSGREHRFLCPLCGDGKPKDSAHRSLCANLQSGAWNCKRCKATGKLSDFWQERPQYDSREIARRRVAQAFALSESRVDEAKPRTTETANNWRQQLRGLCPLNGTSGAKYVQRRGVALEVAHVAGARFSANFYGRAAVVFPIRDRSAALVAASGRYIDGRDNPKTRIAGAKRDGVFCAPVQLPSGRTLQPFDKDAPAIILTEAPIDALSIATAGFPAIALCGTSGAAWLHHACGLKRVFLAFDADDAGDNAAVALTRELTTYGASCERLRPDNAKDWNETLCTSGAVELTELLAASVLLDTTLAATDNEYSIFDD